MEFLWTLAILFRERPDIIHTHWLIPQGFIGALVHSITGIPHVATVHGSDLNIMKKNRLLRSLCRFIVRNSAAVTVNSTYMKRQLEEVAQEALPKIFVIPMGVDLASFHQRSPVYDRKKAQSEHIILSVGRLISIKGTRFLIEAMPAVVHAVPAARLVIIGTGPEEERLMKRVRELSLDDYVRFLGTIRHDELIPYYQGADVFVLPSITIAGMTEGLGVVLLEAMAAGCPVIGSDVGGIPDIITDGENGFLVPEQNSEILAEKIIQLLSEDNLRDKFRKNGFAKINTMYDWEIITEKFSAVYFEVLKFPRGHDTEFI
jgi:N-acetyl-alpha-D-glucosaminyl L-malate synthase BshA